MTQKKKKSLAFKQARKAGLSYYWAQQWARIKMGRYVDWDWKQFQLDNPDFVVSFDYDYDQVTGDFRNQIRASSSKCVLDYDDFYGFTLVTITVAD